MEKIKARFVTLSNPGNYVKRKTLEYVTIYQVEFPEEVAKKIYEQSEQYFLSVFNSYFYENDVHGEARKGEMFGGNEIKDLISSFSPVYSTDKPQADILVSGEEFIGVVVLMRSQSGSTWRDDRREWFVIHHKDGTIQGVNKAEIAIYTEDVSKEETNSYYLIKK
jgi:hypothetical protein